jgi:hypothetical protein
MLTRPIGCSYGRREYGPSSAIEATAAEPMGVVERKVKVHELLLPVLMVVLLTLIFSLCITTSTHTLACARIAFALHALDVALGPCLLFRKVRSLHPETIPRGSSVVHAKTRES